MAEVWDTPNDAINAFDGTETYDEAEYELRDFGPKEISVTAAQRIAQLEAGGMAPGGGLYDAYALLADVKADDADGGTFTSGAWRTRVLNTEHDPDGFVTLAANQFVLAAGTYRFHGRAPAYHTNGARHQAKIRNITASTDALLGSSAYCGADDQSDSVLEGEVTVAVETTFEIQHIIQVTEADVGFGIGGAFGVGEVFARLGIWRRSA